MPGSWQVIHKCQFGQTPNPVPSVRSQLQFGLALTFQCISPSSLASIHQPTLAGLPSDSPCHHSYPQGFANVGPHVWVTLPIPCLYLCPFLLKGLIKGQIIKKCIAQLIFTKGVSVLSHLDPGIEYHLRHCPPSVPPPQRDPPALTCVTS